MPWRQPRCLTPPGQPLQCVPGVSCDRGPRWQRALRDVKESPPAPRTARGGVDWSRAGYPRIAHGEEKGVVCMGETRGWTLLVAVVLIASLAGGGARGGDAGVQQELKALRQQLLEQQKRIDALEALLRGTIAKDVAALRREVDAAAQPGPAAPFASWAEKIKFKGDLRYRHEFIDDESRARERQRHRLRLRLGLEAHPSEDLDVFMRMVTGGESPIGTNQTLDGAFSSKDWMLDRAYADWHPAALRGVHLLGGKMGYPLFKPGNNQLIFDNDLSVEGLAATYKHPMSETTQLFAGLGGFWVDENANGADVMLYAAQVGVRQQVSEGIAVTLGGGSLRYTNLRGRTVLYDQADPYGNSAINDPEVTTLDCTAGGDPVICTEDRFRYTEDYHLCEAFCQVDLQAGGLPLSLYGDFVHNRGAGSGKDTAWLLGATLGKAKEPGSWQVGYNYREVEADAVVGAFTESDFNGGGTGGEGHKLSAAYQLSKATQLAMTYYWTNSEGNGGDDSYRRLELDFKVKF